MLNNEMINEIDIIHKEANNALKNKQLDLYVGCFGDDLQYKQLNGKTIGKKKLITDIRKYFNRIRNFSGDYERKEFTVENDKIIEKVVQHSKVAIKVFIFFSKNWTIEREGIYEWKKIRNVWKIVKVEILKERIF
jgi:hypothetical protein